MADRSGFEHLKEDFPVFLIKNKTDVAKIIDLIGDNDVQVPGKATVKVNSADLHQIPSSEFFKIEEPNFKTLVKYGILKQAEKADTAKKAAPVPQSVSAETEKPATSSKSDTSTGGKSGSNTADK